MLTPEEDCLTQKQHSLTPEQDLLTPEPDLLTPEVFSGKYNRESMTKWPLVVIWWENAWWMGKQLHLVFAYENRVLLWVRLRLLGIGSESLFIWEDGWATETWRC